MRRFRIKARLLIAFFIMVFFALVIGLTGYISLTYIGNSAVKTIHNVIILNDIYDHFAIIDSSVYHMLYSTTAIDFERTIREYTENLLRLLNKYIEIKDQFSDVFTPGEIQNMSNLFEMFNENYIPILNEIFYSVKQGQRDKARSVYINQFVQMHNSFIYYVNNLAFIKNLKYSDIQAAKNNENALFSAYLMMAIVLMSLFVSVKLALSVTKSIFVPLSELEAAAVKIANGELDVQLVHSESDDEIAHLSQRLQEMLIQLDQVQQLKMEAMEARYQIQKAEASARSKSDFLAKMSHEIRTPMNAISGMAELALREDLPPAACEHILTIKQASANLLSIINDILDFSKIEIGKLEIVPGDYFFSSLINDVISIVRMKVIDSQVRFIVNIDCNIPNALFGDEIRIRQVFLNLLSNAVKYTEKGYVSLNVVGSITNDNIVHLTIEVTDSGRGIKQEYIEKLFEDFFQIDLEKNKGIEGTGLGLAITRNILNAMGGDVSVSSEYGKGSTFTVTLPQKVRGHEKLAAVENPGEKRVLVYELRHEIYVDSIVRAIGNLDVECMIISSDSEFYEKMASGTYNFVFIASNLYENVRETCSKFESNITTVLLTEFGEAVANQNLRSIAMPVHSMSVANVLNGLPNKFSYRAGGDSVVRFTAPDAYVLVVDDVNTNLNVAQGLLVPYKIQVKLCKSGIEAIEAITAKRYDLVFMDHMMPGINGIETTARIRVLGIEDPYYENVPIVALTANVVSGTKEMFLKNGFDDFLSKPIDTVVLNTILEKWIPKDKQEKSAVEINITEEAWERNTNQDIEIEGVNVKKGITMSGGTVEKYMQTIAIFLRDGFEKAGKIKKCLEMDNLPLYVTYVHALKSAAANIGAGELFEMAKALEAAGEQGDLAFIQTHNSKLLAALEVLMNNISGALKANKQEEPADMALLSAELAKLKEAIDNLSPGAIKAAVKNIQPFAHKADIGDSIEIILQNTLIGEYEEAVITIDTLLSSISAS